MRSNRQSRSTALQSHDGAEKGESARRKDPNELVIGIKAAGEALHGSKDVVMCAVVKDGSGIDFDSNFRLLWLRWPVPERALKVQVPRMELEKRLKMMEWSWTNQMGGRNAGRSIGSRCPHGGMSSMHAIWETR